MADLDLGELHDEVSPAKLKLGIGGRRYVVAPCSGEVYLRLQDVQARIEGITEANAEIDRLLLRDVHKMALGDAVWDKMIKDEVSGADLRRAGSAAFYWQLGSQELTLLAWTGEPGKAPRSQTSRGTGTRRTTRPAAATTTRGRASGSTTKGRTKTS